MKEVVIFFGGRVDVTPIYKCSDYDGPEHPCPYSDRIGEMRWCLCCEECVEECELDAEGDTWPGDRGV